MKVGDIANYKNETNYIQGTVVSVDSIPNSNNGEFSFRMKISKVSDIYSRDYQVGETRTFIFQSKWWSFETNTDQIYGELIHKLIELEYKLKT